MFTSPILACVILLAVTAIWAQSDEGCQDFSSGGICPLTIDNVLEIDSKSMKSIQECQYSCFRDKLCNHFTFFQREGSETKCVHFNECPEQTPCKSCFTGPGEPSLTECEGVSTPSDATTQAETSTQEPKMRTTTLVLTPEDIETLGTTIADEATTTSLASDDATTTQTNQDKTTTRMSPRTPKQLDDDDDEDTTTGNDVDEFEVTGVDDGLLSGEDDPVELPTSQTTDVPDLAPIGDEVGPDEEVDMTDDEEAFSDDYFDEEPTTPVSGDGSGGPVSTRPKIFNCIMGGYGPQGPIPNVTPMIPSVFRRAIHLPPIPPQFPMGSEGTMGTVLNSELFMCSPGTERGSFARGFPTLPNFQSGGCMKFSQGQKAWQPVGSPMNTYRGGGSISRMGRFIVATGGYPQMLNSIEVLNTRNPKRWRVLSKLTLPNPTFDHCTVAINKTAMLVTGGVGQESQTILLDLKAKKSEALQPMKQPRRKHSCIKAKVNGRDGVIVAGGQSDAVPDLASLEFFDLNEGNWLNLGRMRQGRRHPGIMTLGGNLIIAGGEATDLNGRNVILDSLETLRKRTWRPVKQRLGSPRSRFGFARVPRNFFF